MFSDVWSENAALFERLMEIYSNPPILYYGFKHEFKISLNNTGHLTAQVIAADQGLAFQNLMNYYAGALVYGSWTSD